MYTYARDDKCIIDTERDIDYRNFNNLFIIYYMICWTLALIIVFYK